MKVLILLSFILFSATSFAKQIDIDTKTSTLEWLGQKTVPGDDHNGTLSLKNGTITVDDKMMLTGGTITIDMNTINNKDLTGEWKKKLEGHLKNEDFFDVKKHPEATFKITKVVPKKKMKDTYSVTGNLTLRGKTNSETFDLTIKKSGKTMMAEGKVAFDRNKYGVTYNSETSVLKKLAKIAKDKVIKDKIQLTVKLQTKKI